MEPNHQRIPFDDNRKPFLAGLSYVDNRTVVPLLADPATGRLLVSTTGGSGGTQYNKGQTVSTPTGTVALGQNSSSVLNPLTIDSYGNQTSATYDNAGNGIGSGLYNGQYYLNADISSAGTDGAVYNTTSFPQIDAVGGKGTDGNAHVLLTDPNGKLATTSLGVVDSNNSTTTTLLANATYTGTSTSVLPYSSISVILYSNVASATQGLAIEFSMDGTNWDDSSTFSFTPGTGVNQGQTFKSPARSQYYRIQYTNGATNQTTFRLQTVLKPNALIGDSVAIGSTITTNNHSLVTTSSIVGLSTAGGGNTYVPVKVTNTGQLSTTANISDSNGAAIAVGQTTKSASLPVTLASDQGSLSVSQATGTNLHTVTDSGSVTNATLSAETTKVIGTVRNADGSGNLLTSTTNALDVNIKSGSISNTSFAATQATASALNMTEANSSTIATNTTGLNNTVGTTGSAAPSKGILIQGSDGTYARNLYVSSTGTTRTVATIDQTTPGSTNAVYVQNTSVPVSQSTASSLNATVVPGTSTGSAVPSVSYPTGFQARSTDITATTSTYNTIGITDLVGKQVVMPYALNQLFVKGSNSATTTSSTSLITAAGAGVSNYITSISVMNTGATTTVVNIQDGSTTMYQVGAPAGGGAVVTLPVPIKGTANTAVNFATLNASTTVYVSVAGYTGA